MAQQPQPQFDIPYQNVKVIKTERLGIGSYGAVYKAMYDDLPCAAKILHPALFQFATPGTTSVMQKFEQECQLLRAVKHPHIVQYLGTCLDPESRLPVLLMELMDESLTRFLKRTQEPLPYHTEVNLCHDVALALSYLHSNRIVHRDLSSNNVLMMAGSRAKVTDFGMAKLYDVNRTSLTQCPGTLVYMPPEALGDQPVYTCKLDSFSFGVLCVQIVTRQFPDPSNRVARVEALQTPTGVAELPIPEIERRRSHISLIRSAHPLMEVVRTCLRDRDVERPSTQELCRYISELKLLPNYITSVQQSQVRSVQIRKERSTIQSLQQQLSALQLHTQSDQIQREILQQRQQILELRNLIAVKTEQLSGKEREHHQLQGAVATCQREIQQLREQLQSSEEVTSKFQQNLTEREKAIQELQRQIQELQQLTQNLHEAEQLLQSKDHQQQHEIKQQRQQILQLQHQITGKDKQLASNKEQLADKNHQLQLNKAAIVTHQQQLRQQLQQSSEQVTADLMEREKMIQELQRKIQNLQQLLQSKDHQLRGQQQDIQQQVLQLRRQIASKDKQLASKEEQLASKEEQLASKEGQLAVQSHHL